MMHPPRKLFALIGLATSSQIQVANGAVTVPYYLVGLEAAIGTPTVSVVQPGIILVDSIARRKRHHRCQRHPLRHGQSLSESVQLRRSSVLSHV
jgi:hypothetical protein